MANKAGPKGYSRQDYQQPRKSQNLDELSVLSKIGASAFQLLHETGSPKTKKYRQEKGITLWGTKK